MPFLNLTLSQTPSNAVADRLASTLTDLTATLLGKNRELTVVTIDPRPGARWYVGSRHRPGFGACAYHLDVDITAGTNSVDEKERYLAQVHEAIVRILGDVEPTSYIVVHDRPADAWGYGGRTQARRRTDAAALAALSPA